MEAGGGNWLHPTLVPLLRAHVCESPPPTDFRDERPRRVANMLCSIGMVSRMERVFIVFCVCCHSGS